MSISEKSRIKKLSQKDKRRIEKFSKKILEDPGTDLAYLKLKEQIKKESQIQDEDRT